MPTRDKPTSEVDRQEIALPKHAGGRPSKYKPEYVEQVAKLCHMGATDAEIADFFEVDITTIWEWRSTHLEFSHAIQNMEKDLADGRVKRSLYQRACGYTYDAVKIFNGPSGVVQVRYREHVPPDVAACFIWLKNRRRNEWRDKHEPSQDTLPARTFTITIGNVHEDSHEGRLLPNLIDVSPESKN